MEFHNVPEPLKRKLEFGDPEQIAALKKIEKETEEREKYERQVREGLIKTYQIEVEFSGTNEFIVEATSPQEARELADEGMAEEFLKSDIEIENISIHEIPPET